MQRIKELVQQLNKLSFEYYTLDNPRISDKQYDILYDELVELETETGLILSDSPTQKVGGEILKGFDKVVHKNKLWSLDKANTFDDVKAFTDKVESFVKNYNKTHTDILPKPSYIVTKKFDGLSVKCSYNAEGKYKQGSSRGTGEIGEDITLQVGTILNLPKQLNNNDEVCLGASFHGEGLMPKKALIEYNKTAKEPLKNVRNGVAGALRNLNVSETAKRKCIIFFYNINEINNEIIEFNTYEQQLNYMKYRGLPVADYILCDSYDKVIDEINNIEEQRPNLPYDIDGAVISVNDMRTRELLGYTIKYPNHSLAYKYEAEETTTKLIDVEWNVSRRGKIVPTAILEPVELGGTTVKRATLNNLTDIKRKGVKLNATVFIRRSNDVIPEITGVSEDEVGLAIDIIPPTNCPNCGQPTEIRISDSGTETVHCINDSCGLAKQIAHYVSRDALNIEGLSEKTIEKLIDLELLKSVADIYYLPSPKSKEIIIKQDGFGIKSYNNLVQSIEKSKKCKLSNLLYGLGIDNVGKGTSKRLIEHFKGEDSLHTLNNIIQAKHSDILKVDDCGEVIANSIIEWFSDSSNLEMLGYITQCVLTFAEESKVEVQNNDNILFGKKVYPTGKFTLNKKDLKIKLEELGAIIANGYSKSLDYLICGGDTSKSSKVGKALIDNVNLMTEEELLKLLK